MKKEFMHLFARDEIYRKIIININQYIQAIEQAIKLKKITNVADNLAGIYSNYNRIYNTFGDLTIFVYALLEDEK